MHREERDVELYEWRGGSREELFPNHKQNALTLSGHASMECCFSVWWKQGCTPGHRRHGVV